MTSDTNESMDDINSTNICLVCGFKDAKKNYGAFTCSSCKVFFRRNENLDRNINQCHYDGNCQIDVNSRKICRVCRLNKCFQVGMNKDLIRSPYGRNSSNKCQIKQQLLQNKNVNVITNQLIDKHIELTVNEQSQLFNIIDSYDIYSPISNIINIIENSLNNPSKIRLKIMKNNLIIIEEYFYSSIIPFIKINQKYSSLIINDQKKLIQRNIRNLSHLNQLFIFNQIDFLNDSIHQTILLEQYGQLYIDNLIINIQKLPQDKKLIKIFLIILTFSTCLDIVEFNLNQFLMEENFLSSPLNILNIQNNYVEIIFKYLIINSDYLNASKQFENLIKILLNQNIFIEIGLTNDKHYKFIENIFKKTE